MFGTNELWASVWTYGEFSDSLSRRFVNRDADSPQRGGGSYSPLQGKYLLTEQHRIPTVGASDGHHAADGVNLLTVDNHPPATGAGDDRLPAGDYRPFAGAGDDRLSPEASDCGQRDDITISHLPTKATGEAVLDALRSTPFGDLVFLFLGKSHSSTLLHVDRT